MAKGKKTGGRTKNTPNKERKQLVDLLAEQYPGYDPVISMAHIANDENNDIGLRLQANKEVAKYTHPQLKAIEHSGEVDTGTIDISLKID